MKYWHELTDEEVKAMDGAKTWGEVMSEYKQPDWCSYPDALSGIMGCWSLTDFDIRKNISETFCKDCECFKTNNK